jgi:ABC-type lipoprotein export system ATPase subunit
MSDPVLRLRGIARRYNAGRPNEVRVLDDAALDIAPGEVVALAAPSGAGKSTLLHIAGLLDLPDAGEVIVQGRPMQAAGDRARTAARRQAIGFVYQFHHLLADEPTGNLDPATSDRVFDMLLGLVRATGMAALIATHNAELAARMDRRLRIAAGRVVPG